MAIFKKKRDAAASAQATGIPQSAWFSLSDDSFCCRGYTSLDKNPDIMTACRTIAETIGSMTIHLMANQKNGDQRIINELSRKIDINPSDSMTRKTFMEAAIMNLLLYGKGNSVILPHTRNGYLEELEVIDPARVSFDQVGRSYKIQIDGIAFDPSEVIHLVMNPDQHKPWMGRGIQVSLKDIANNLKQAQATEKGYLESPKPSIIVKVDALTEEFSSPAGREKLLQSYIETTRNREPWMIPAEQFSVEQIKPLTLADLAIADTVTLNKRAVAAIIGVPPFCLGIGDYDAAAWNGFINGKIRNLVVGIQQEFTKKLILSEKMYLRFNSRSLIDWDIQKKASVFYGANDRGLVTGNEVRDQLDLNPMEGLDELRILENYIPYDMSGQQKKLIQEGEA